MMLYTLMQFRLLLMVVLLLGLTAQLETPAHGAQKWPKIARLEARRPVAMGDTQRNAHFARFIGEQNFARPTSFW